MYKGH